MPNEPNQGIPVDPERDRIISESEAARRLNISTDTLKRAAARGRYKRIAMSPRRRGYWLSEILNKA